LLPDEGLVEPNGLDDDGQGEGEEGDGRHHRSQTQAGHSHSSVLNRSTTYEWQVPSLDHRLRFPVWPRPEWQDSAIMIHR
jgi:hypothetical protein